MCMCRRISIAIVFLASLAAFTGCDLLNPASRLYGTWKLDVDATIDRAAGGNAFKKAALQTMWSLGGGDVTMEFRPDGTGEMKGATAIGGGNETGTWKLLSADSSTLRVELTTDKGTHEQTLRMLDPNTFEVDLNAGGQVNTATFRRVVQ